MPLIHKVNFYFFLSGDCGLRLSRCFGHLPSQTCLCQRGARYLLRLAAVWPTPAAQSGGLLPGTRVTPQLQRRPRHRPTAHAALGGPRTAPCCPRGSASSGTGQRGAGEAGAVLHQPHRGEPGVPPVSLNLQLVSIDWGTQVAAGTLVVVSFLKA